MSKNPFLDYDWFEVAEALYLKSESSNKLREESNKNGLKYLLNMEVEARINDLRKDYEGIIAKTDDPSDILNSYLREYEVLFREKIENNRRGRNRNRIVLNGKDITQPIEEQRKFTCVNLSGYSGEKLNEVYHQFIEVKKLSEFELYEDLKPDVDKESSKDLIMEVLSHLHFYKYLKEEKEKSLLVDNEETPKKIKGPFHFSVIDEGYKGKRFAHELYSILRMKECECIKDEDASYLFEKGFIFFKSKGERKKYRRDEVPPEAKIVWRKTSKFLMKLITLLHDEKMIYEKNKWVVASNIFVLEDDNGVRSEFDSRNLMQSGYGNNSKLTKDDVKLIDKIIKKLKENRIMKTNSK